MFLFLWWALLAHIVSKHCNVWFMIDSQSVLVLWMCCSLSFDPNPWRPLTDGFIPARWQCAIAAESQSHPGKVSCYCDQFSCRMTCLAFHTCQQPWSMARSQGSQATSWSAEKSKGYRTNPIKSRRIEFRKNRQKKQPQVDVRAGEREWRYFQDAHPRRRRLPFWILIFSLLFFRDGFRFSLFFEGWILIFLSETGLNFKK